MKKEEVGFPIVPLITAGASILGTYLAYKGQKKAIEGKKKIVKEQIKAEKETLEEQKKMLEMKIMADLKKTKMMTDALKYIAPILGFGVVIYAISKS